MTVTGHRRANGRTSEEVVAAAGVVLGLTVAVGGMAALIGAVTGQAMVLVLMPTVALGIGILRHATALAGWAGVGVWLMLIPNVPGEGLIAPVAMTVLCAAIAIGPGRFADWVGRDFAGGRVERHDQAWIEEDGRPLE